MKNALHFSKIALLVIVLISALTALAILAAAEAYHELGMITVHLDDTHTKLGSVFDGGVFTGILGGLLAFAALWFAAILVFFAGVLSIVATLGAIALVVLVMALPLALLVSGFAAVIWLVGKLRRATVQTRGEAQLVV